MTSKRFRQAENYAATTPHVCLHIRMHTQNGWQNFEVARGIIKALDLDTDAGLALSKKRLKAEGGII